jgi:CheY-like chemotaxis protein
MRNSSRGLNYLNTNAFALPEIIFLDINMPVVNGFEFLDKFEKLNNTVKEHCAIIMLSSSVHIDDIKRAEADKHVRFFLSKPLTVRTSRRSVLLFQPFAYDIFQVINT